MENPQAVEHETVMDTGAEQLGKTYAQALMAAASKSGLSDKVVEQLGTLVNEYLAGSPKLSAAFASPRIDIAEKQRIVERIFGDEFEPLLVNFLKVMASRGRLGYVDSVYEGAQKQLDQMSGRVLAKVKTAVPLDDSLRSTIIERLGGALGKQVRLQEVVDESLIGGMVIRVGDTVFDNSVAGRIDLIAKRAKQGFSAALSEKFANLVE
ncbi:ATP synthase F1 subunit delta [Roseiconus lacunae]|uniref:ATP synthase subunit delta n=1 Tax=Roseiconus lacunae TaxID=2605694 RepID=A0ABT7PM69_9BACT|nr:ATP synthase F1 subunit delta [Roseiconus lacunae]MCD0461527.1 ATP synthase F1 subunit delta [Roseiconus lacunae]MDM4017604.1 ATP synthase F1 subunit delta [Roseiconus lacunae]WRQ51132.1 ATP synthase F1 subunit delta [Stieleria sp. HD01]